jgi:hypothetical protein
MVLSASKGSLTVNVASTTKAASACIMISFDAVGSQSVMKSMQHAKDLVSTEKVHESAVFGAIVSCVRSRLVLAPADNIKTGVQCVRGCLMGGRGTISLICAPNKSAVRRGLTGFVAALAPPKIMAAYMFMCRNIGETPDKEYFAHIASNLLSAIKNADILVTGKVSIKQDGLKDMVSTVGDKWSKIPTVPGKKSAPKTSEKVKVESKILEKSTKVSLPKGLARHLLVSLLMKRLPGVCFTFDGNSLYVGCSQSKLEAAGNKDRASDAAKKIYAIVKKHGIEPVIHAAAIWGCGDATDLKSDCGKSWTASNLAVSV